MCCLGIDKFCIRRLKGILWFINFVLGILGLSLLGYGTYLLWAHSWLVSFACGTLIVSGSILFTFSGVFCCGGRKVAGFLVTYATVLFVLFLSQIALLVLYERKSSRQWIRKQAPKPIVDIVEHNQRIVQHFLIVIVIMELIAIFLACILQSCTKDDAARDALPYYVDDDDDEYDETHDLLQKQRVKEEKRRLRQKYLRKKYNIQ